MKITTNRHPRNLLSWYELTLEEQHDFDYVQNPEEEGFDRFFRYRGCTYDTHEFMSNYILPADSPLRAWQGHHSDSFFSGIVMSYNTEDRYDGTVIVGTFTC